RCDVAGEKTPALDSRGPGRCRSPRDGLMTSSQARFRALLWLQAGAFMLHEAEEWNILGWYRSHHGDLPGTNDASVRIGLFAYVVIAALWTLAATRASNPRVACLTVLPLWLVLFVNALQHVYWAVQFSAYNPGLLTAVTTLLPVTVAVAVAALRGGFISRPVA